MSFSYADICSSVAQKNIMLAHPQHRHHLGSLPRDGTEEILRRGAAFEGEAQRLPGVWTT